MMSGRLRVVLAIGVLSIVPVRGYAQEATISGTVTDSTGAVLPGVTITAVHEASGNTFEAVTTSAASTAFRRALASIRVTAELAGFATSAGRAWTCWSASRRSSTWRWRFPASPRTVTVTGEAPLIDTSSRRSAATSTRGRCRSCRSTAATGST